MVNCIAHPVNNKQTRTRARTRAFMHENETIDSHNTQEVYSNASKPGRRYTTICVSGANTTRVPPNQMQMNAHNVFVRSCQVFIYADGFFLIELCVLYLSAAPFPLWRMDISPISGGGGCVSVPVTLHSYNNNTSSLSLSFSLKHDPSIPSCGASPSLLSSNPSDIFAMFFVAVLSSTIPCFVHLFHMSAHSSMKDLKRFRPNWTFPTTNLPFPFIFVWQLPRHSSAPFVLCPFIFGERSLFHSLILAPLDSFCIFFSVFSVHTRTHFSSAAFLAAFHCQSAVSRSFSSQFFPLLFKYMIKAIQFICIPLDFNKSAQIIAFLWLCVSFARPIELNRSLFRLLVPNALGSLAFCSPSPVRR